jgi:hypothetical protein
MSPVVGWTLAALAVVLGWWAYGGAGVVLAISVTVFWLLLQFSRALRVMRAAAGRPVGHVDSAVMFNAKLRAGMTLMQVIVLTKSLGQKVGEGTARGDDPEHWRWSDPGGVAVTLTLRRGKLVSWRLDRPAAT